ncbi:hypothetical protein ACGF5O_34635 [Streptomyces sp. NPDC048291]|uniref:hypothetical protein n=1 Tax=Streptomyces sp. NPDC048291 TaxID=3365530 RepID=UPI00371E90BF
MAEARTTAHATPFVAVVAPEPEPGLDLACDRTVHTGRIVRTGHTVRTGRTGALPRPAGGEVGAVARAAPGRGRGGGPGRGGDGGPRTTRLPCRGPVGF